MKAPDTVDLHALDPARSPRWNDAIGKVAARGRELRRLRHAVVRRGAVAVAVAAAVAIALWVTAPEPRAAAPQAHAGEHDALPGGATAMLGWAIHDVDPSELLELGGTDAR